MWKDYVALFSEKHRVFTIDLLVTVILTVWDMFTKWKIMPKLLTSSGTFKNDKAIILGHSMGGYVGLALAELYPAKIQKLVY